MITRVEISDHENTCVDWWRRVEPLQKLSKIEFTPGINIIWGPNGSGKSTLLTALAKVTHSKKSGRSVVTHNSLRDLNKSVLGQDVGDGLKVFCDGQSVLYYSPLESIGLVGGMAGFDSDFFSEGLESLGHHRISSGQSAQAKLHSIMKKRKTEVEWRVRSGDSPAFKFTKETFAVQCDPGPQTLLMDEPDAHLDWTNKLKLWDIFRRADKFQFIIATHSPFGLRCEGANYIELDKKYKTESEIALRMGGLWTVSDK